MTPVALNDGLSQISLLFIYAAMLVYTVSFLSFSWQLTRLSSDKKKVRAAATKLERVGIALLIVADVFHGVGVVLRGIAASRVPWANMYEFSITAALIILMIYLMSVRVRELRDRLRLPLEPREPFGLAGNRRRQNLDRHVAPEIAVVRPVHLAHPPGPLPEAGRGVGGLGSHPPTPAAGCRAVPRSRPAARPARGRNPGNTGRCRARRRIRAA